MQTKRTLVEICSAKDGITSNEIFIRLCKAEHHNYGLSYVMSCLRELTLLEFLEKKKDESLKKFVWIRTRKGMLFVRDCENEQIRIANIFRKIEAMVHG